MCRVPLVPLATMRTAIFLALAFLGIARACSLDFATGSTFDSLTRRSGLTVLFVYNPQGKSVDSQVAEVLNFSATGNRLYSTEGPESVYCPRVVIADGVSFDPFQERVFQRIRHNASFSEEAASPTVQQVQAMGLESTPALVLLNGGTIEGVWDPDVSAWDMLSLFRSAVDTSFDVMEGLPSEDDALVFASSRGRSFSKTVIIPHFARVDPVLRAAIHSTGAVIVRAKKGSKSARVLFADRSLDGKVYIYAVVPVGSVASISGISESVADNAGVASQWTRRLADGGLSLLRTKVTKSLTLPIGSNAEDGKSVVSLVFPSIAEGFRHMLALSGARRRTPCVVTLFLKDVSDTVNEIYRSRISKLSEMAHGNSTLGETCTFLVSDADLNVRHFTSFGFMFKSLYRSAHELKAQTSHSMLPQSRQRFSDNLIGVEFSGRRFVYTGSSFNVQLLAQFLRKVLAGRAIRVRQCEQFRDAPSLASCPYQRLHHFHTDCDALYYDGLRDFRRDSLVILLPSSETRACIGCTANGSSCRWNVSSTQCSRWEGIGSALNAVFDLAKPSLRSAMSVHYYVPTENDLNPYLRIPSIRDNSDGISFMFIHRADKMDYFRRQTAFQPGVHDQHLATATDILTTSRLVLPPKESLASRIDQILLFIHEGSDVLPAHFDEAPVYVPMSDDDADDDGEF